MLMRDHPVPPSIEASLMPLRLEALSFEGGGRRIIDSVDLTLEARGLTVVMGPNGAGKSVLLRLAHGLLKPTTGRVLYDAAPIDSDVRRRQAMVFQRPVLLRRSVAANVDFALGLRGRASVQRREGLLDRVGLTHLSAQPARRLSGGEQQRLAFARALATEPEILFVDEPTSNLDPAAMRAIEAITRQVQAEGCKVVFVTHDIAQARRLADDVVFLHNGRIADHRPAADFFSNPISDAAAAYLEGRIDF